MSFKELVGQHKLKKRLSEEMRTPGGNTYLFAGAKGMGKKKFAEVFAQGLLCEDPGEDGPCGKCKCCIYFKENTHPDMVRIEISEKKKVISVEDLKDIVIRTVDIAPQISERKVYLINGDNLNTEGQNALLKSLEEPPAGVFFLITVTDLSVLLQTILSRGITINILPLPVEEITSLLKEKCPDSSGDMIKVAASFSGGNPGRALALASDDSFIQDRDHIKNLVISLPEMSPSTLLTEETSFWELFRNDREKLSEMILLFYLLLADLMKIKTGEAEAGITNEELRFDLELFITSHKEIGMGKIEKAMRALEDFNKAMEVNSNYDASVSSMLIKIQKEFR